MASLKVPVNNTSTAGPKLKSTLAITSPPSPASVITKAPESTVTLRTSATVRHTLPSSVLLFSSDSTSSITAMSRATMMKPRRLRSYSTMVRLMPMTSWNSSPTK